MTNSAQWGRVGENHTEAIKQFMKWLNYKDNREKFVFVYNKADTVTLESRMNSLADMCSKFDADPNHTKCTWTIEGERKVVKMKLTTGFPAGAAFAQVKEDYRDFLQACLCPDMPGPKESERIPVNKNACTIL